jgi:hypothetical protein
MTCAQISTGRERIHRWWVVKPLGEHSRAIMGKPSVQFQKVINTETSTGQIVGVNAQQYVVLVMDVPDMRAALDRCVAGAWHAGWQQKPVHFHVPQVAAALAGSLQRIKLF